MLCALDPIDWKSNVRSPFPSVCLQNLYIVTFLQTVTPSLNTGGNFQPPYFFPNNNCNHSFILIYFCGLTFLEHFLQLYDLLSHYHLESLNISSFSSLMPCIFLYEVQLCSFVNVLSMYHVLSLVLRAWIAFPKWKGVCNLITKTLIICLMRGKHI